jgi:uncharacterized membrane protein YgdD (TMEM256/DUF423 family)
MAGATSALWIVVAALSGAVAVALGAFAAHGLDLSTTAGAKAREWLQTGSHYGMIHALAMIGVAALARVGLVGGGFATAAQVLFTVGCVLFPGALYLMAFGAPRWLGAIAPIGGTAFILGWLSLAVAAVMNR